MLIKMLLSAPAAAWLSYTITGIHIAQFSAVERIGMEFILLGRVPGTEVYIQFEHILIFAVSLVWIPAVFWAGKRANLFISSRIDGIGEQMELISL